MPSQGFEPWSQVPQTRILSKLYYEGKNVLIRPFIF